MIACAPSDDEIVQANVSQILAAPDKLYHHRWGKLDALTILEVGIRDRRETIQQHKPFSGGEPTEWSKGVVSRLQHEIQLMGQMLQRLYSLGGATSSLARQLQRERECPPPSMRALLAEAMAQSSSPLPQEFSRLLDLDTPLIGVTTGKVRPELVKIAVVTRLTRETLNLSVTAGWGHAGQNGVTMPGKGKRETRGYTAEEAQALGLWTAPAERSGDGALGGGGTAGTTGASKSGVALRLPPQSILGQSTHDVFLNDTACWRNVPEKVWDFTIGGYQVMKKWLSYREHALLGRALTPDEAREVTHLARRLAALILLQPELDANHARVKAETYSWKA